MKKTKQETNWWELLIVLIILVTIFGSPVYMYFQIAAERDTFNKFRSPDQPEATWWDAWSADLRVDAE